MCVGVCVYACVCVCACVRVRACAYVCVWVHAFIYVNDILKRILNLSLHNLHSHNALSTYVYCREFKRLTTLMSEVNNWQLYRNQLNKHLASNTPCIAFLGVYLTEVVHHGCYQGILTNRSAVSSCSAPSHTDAAEGIDGSNNPKALLERYKASASKCISLRRCSPELQCLLHEGGGAPYSETLNYKISVEREP